MCFFSQPHLLFTWVALVVFVVGRFCCCACLFLVCVVCTISVAALCMFRIMRVLHYVCRVLFIDANFLSLLDFGVVT